MIFPDILFISKHSIIQIFATKLLAFNLALTSLKYTDPYIVVHLFLFMYGILSLPP